MGSSKVRDMHHLNDLKRDTEVIYRLRLMKRQADKEAADSREAAHKTAAA